MEYFYDPFPSAERRLVGEQQYVMNNKTLLQEIQYGSTTVTLENWGCRKRAEGGTELAKRHHKETEREEDKCVQHLLVQTDKMGREAAPRFS